MLKYKFEKQCPLNLRFHTPNKPPSTTAAAAIATTSSVPTNWQSYSGTPSSFRMSDGMIPPVPSFPSPESTKLDPKLLHMKIDLEKKEREIISYKKTIEALTEELDGLGRRVKELEQAMRTGSKELHRKSKIDKVTVEELGSVREELENVKEEKAKYQELLKDQTQFVSSGHRISISYHYLSYV